MNLTQRDKIWLTVGGMALLALIAACAAGLLLGWVVWPAGLHEAQPANLESGHKEEYIALVAASYAQDGDLEKAEERLAQLEAPNVRQWVAELADRAISEGRQPAEVQALAGLAQAMGVASTRMIALLASPTPLPTSTPPPTAVPTVEATVTQLPPTQAATPAPPTPTAMPTASPTTAASDTPEPTATPAPPTNTPRPKPTQAPKPTATNTPTPGPKWTWAAQLMGPGQDGQGCDYGNLQIHVTVLNAAGAQMNGVWVHDRYSGQYQVTGNVDSPDWGPGETKFEYGQWGGGSLCVASGEGGPCVSDFTRDMPVFVAPPVDDLFAAGYCNCCEQGSSKERCQELLSAGTCMGGGFGHFTWRVVFRRNF